MNKDMFHEQDEKNRLDIFPKLVVIIVIIVVITVIR